MGAKYHVLPEALDKLLKPQLLNMDCVGTVTTFSMDLAQTENGWTMSKGVSHEPKEDLLEKAMSDETSFFRDLPHLGCRSFKESQIALKARISCYRYQVWVDGLNRHCLERKVPFASTGTNGDNDFRDLIDEVGKLSALRERSGIIQLVGLVFDSTGQQLKGYLCELPVVHNLRGFIGLANLLSRPVPWSVRECWIKQIMEAMADVHAQKLLVGALNLNRIHVRRDGNAVLDLTDCAHRHVPTGRDCIPPELSHHVPHHTDLIASSTVLTYATDVYQLGFITWLLAEHRPSQGGHYCKLAKCTHFPSYQCAADHVSPLQLPPCSQAPNYIDGVIQSARNYSPRQRPAARDLARCIEHHDASEDRVVLEDLFDQFSSVPTAFSVFCSNCLDLATFDHYHCYICDSDDFDLCLPCHDKGVRCWNPFEHLLVRRGIKRGELVEKQGDKL